MVRLRPDKRHRARSIVDTTMMGTATPTRRAGAGTSCRARIIEAVVAVEPHGHGEPGIVALRPDSGRHLGREQAEAHLLVREIDEAPGLCPAPGLSVGRLALGQLRRRGLGRRFAPIARSAPMLFAQRRKVREDRRGGLSSMTARRHVWSPGRRDLVERTPGRRRSGSRCAGTGRRSSEKTVPLAVR